MAGASNTAKYIDNRNHCPFGCQPGHLSEHGYCCHLVGFTNKSKVMECVSYNERGFPCIGLSREIILKTDKLVNPERIIKDELAPAGRLVPEWVSARVYRQKTPEEVAKWRKEHVAMRDEETAAVLDVV